MKKKTKRIEFKFFAPTAKQVLLSGTFNKWSDRSDPMKKDESGTWKKVKMLQQGSHEYKFIVDGQWTLDPGCNGTAQNRYGTLNSVIAV